MTIHFNRFERSAGLFVLGALLGVFVSLITIAVKQGWFEPRSHFTTSFEEAEGIHAGTVVQMSGLHVGSVEEVELTSENRIQVHFFVFGKFIDNIRTGSQVMLIRPFVIGERVVDITPGQLSTPVLADGSVIPSQSSTDLMSLLSGRTIGQSLESFSQLLSKMQEIAKTVLDADKNNQISESVITMESLVKNLNQMSVEVVKLTKQLNRDDKLSEMVGNLAVTTREVNSMLPEFQQRAPHLAKDMSELIGNLNEITTHFKVYLPAMDAMGPDLPRVSRRAVEALDEAVVLMKAMQRSYFFRSHANEVRSEEAGTKSKSTDSSRKPSSEPQNFDP